MDTIRAFFGFLFFLVPNENPKQDRDQLFRSPNRDRPKRPAKDKIMPTTIGSTVNAKMCAAVPELSPYFAFIAVSRLNFSGDFVLITKV
jgi:hypothetical protein